MKYKLFIAILLALSWYIFSGVDDIFYIICGIISMMITLIIMKKMTLLKSNIAPKFKLLHIKYLIWLISEIVKSSIQITIFIWSKNPNKSEKYGWIDCNLSNDFKKTIYANSITLTPGTVCIDIIGDKMQIHSLTKEGWDCLADNKLLEIVRKL